MVGGPRRAIAGHRVAGVDERADREAEVGELGVGMVGALGHRIDVRAAVGQVEKAFAHAETASATVGVTDHTGAAVVVVGGGKCHPQNGSSL